MSEKILMVDDEANVLDAYRRQLGRTFEIDSRSVARKLSK